MLIKDKGKRIIIILFLIILVLSLILFNLIIPMAKFNDYNEFNDVEVYGEADNYLDFIVPMNENASNENRTIRFPILYRILTWRIERLEKLREFCLVDE